jgi:rubrerythrin
MARPIDPNNILHKTCPTCKQPFTCERRKEKTYCTRTCAVNDPVVKEKNRIGVAKAFDSKYGGHPMAVNPQTKEKLTLTMTELYGKPWFSQTDEFADKTKATKLEKYGDENYNNINRMKQTCLERYGADNYRKTDEYHKKYEKTCLKKYGTPHASSSKQYKDSHKRLMFEKFITSSRFTNFIAKFSFDEYDGVTKEFNKKYSFQCNRCGELENHDISNGKTPRCTKCDKQFSGFQTEVMEYVKTILPPNEPVLANDRTMLYPLELDILIPSIKLAIETDGLYYHTEVSGGRNKTYHINKTKLCISKGVRLIHIFENEWNYKRDVVKSILASIIAKKNTIIYARECEIK